MAGIEKSNFEQVYDKGKTSSCQGNLPMLGLIAWKLLLSPQIV